MYEMSCVCNDNYSMTISKCVTVSLSKHVIMAIIGIPNMVHSIQEHSIIFFLCFITYSRHYCIITKYECLTTLYIELMLGWFPGHSGPHAAEKIE